MKLRNILTVVGLLGLALVIVLNLHAFRDFFHVLSSLRWYVLLIVVAVQAISYGFNAFYYRSILKVFNYTNVPTHRLFEGALATGFISYLVPSAGMAGAVLLTQVLHPEVPRGKAVLVQFMRYGLSALAVLITIPVSLGLIVITRHESKAVNRLAISASLAIIVFAAVVITLVNQEKWLRKLIKKIVSRFKRTFSRFDPKNIENFVDDFFNGYHSMVNAKKAMLRPFGWSILFIIVEILTFYLSFVAFGKFINPGVVIMAYVMANISSIIGGSFFSIGVFELGMVGTLVALGEPLVFALSVTLVYRIVNLLISLPPGFIFYHRFLQTKASS